MVIENFNFTNGDFKYNGNFAMVIMHATDSQFRKLCILMFGDEWRNKEAICCVDRAIPYMIDMAKAEYQNAHAAWAHQWVDVAFYQPTKRSPKEIKKELSEIKKHNEELERDKADAKKKIEKLNKRLEIYKATREKYCYS